MHGYASGSGHRHRWFRHAWAKRVDRFARFIAVGRHEVAFMRSLGVEAERIALIPCGVPEELLGIAAPGTSPSLFLTVGRLVPKKAPQLIVEAFADAVPELPGAKLVMVGDGPLRPDVESIIRSRALQDRVTLTGAQPPSVVKQYLASASVFVQHSVTPPDGDIEGWPVATAEAMAAGLPVIGTDHPGVRDQIDSERTGLLVPERDVQGLRDAMLRLGRDPVLRERIGAEATRYMREFVVPRQVEKLRRVLHDVSRHGARHRGAGAPQAAVAAR
jgi:glycosyltransferase involved in cell wall biosynthesis